MFTCKKKFEVKSHEVVDFVRLLGRVGLKFEFTDEYCVTDELDSSRKVRYRRFYVKGTRRQMMRFYEARDILFKYRLH